MRRILVQMPRRTVALCHSQPTAKRSRARLWAYGLEALAEARGCSVATVRRAVKAGRLDPACLASVAAWVRK